MCLCTYKGVQLVDGGSQHENELKEKWIVIVLATVLGRWMTQWKIQGQLKTCAKNNPASLPLEQSVLDTSSIKITHGISLTQPWPPHWLNALLPSHGYIAVWAKQMVCVMQQRWKFELSVASLWELNRKPQKLCCMSMWKTLKKRTPKINNRNLLL